MKKREMWTAATLLLMASPVLAQEPAPRDSGEHGMSLMTVILEHRAELGLSDDQVARLEAIGAGLRARTAPLRERLREARADMPVPGARAGGGARGGRTAPRAMTPEQREEMRERVRELRPVREEIRSLRRDAREEARAVLTADQQQRLRELMQARRGHHRRPGGDAGHGHRSGRG